MRFKLANMICIILLLTSAIYAQEAQISCGGDATVLQVGQTYTFFLSFRNNGICPGDV